MLTQVIKGWFQKLFAWWPWKQSTPIEYQHVASVVTHGPTAETALWPKREETTSLSDATPCLSALEDQSERVTRPRAEASDPHPLATPASLSNKDKESLEDSGEIPATDPTTQQRLQFLRYLVQRGIVNEGVEKEE
jgi:hypothetical protein